MRNLNSGHSEKEHVSQMGESHPKNEKTSQSDYQRVKALMQELGSPKGFDPIPPDQHRWMMDPGQPNLMRLWGWMIGHTIHWGHRSAFAINKQGEELHLEHAAKDLEMDLANVYREWRRGVSRGIWRNGQPSEGKQKLYLTGKVPRYQPEEDEKMSVQTILPRYLLEQITEWPNEKIHELHAKWQEVSELERHVQAALIACNRVVFTQRQDSILQSFGLEVTHQAHQKKHESPEDAEARRARIEPIKPTIEGYVQTIETFVQSTKTPPDLTNTSLLTLQSKSQRSMSRSVGTLPATEPETHQEGERRTAYNQVPALDRAPTLSETEKQAGNQIFSEIARMQSHEAFKHMEFTREKISPARKSDQLFAFRVLQLVGVEGVPQFLTSVWANLRKLDKAAFGKLPGRRRGSSGPRSLGLILQWAQEYSTRLEEAAGVTALEREKWRTWEIQACKEILENPEETADVKHAIKIRLQELKQLERQTA